MIKIQCAFFRRSFTERWGRYMLLLETSERALDLSRFSQVLSRRNHLSSLIQISLDNLKHLLNLINSNYFLDNSSKVLPFSIKCSTFCIWKKKLTQWVEVKLLSTITEVSFPKKKSKRLSSISNTSNTLRKSYMVRSQAYLALGMPLIVRKKSDSFSMNTLKTDLKMNMREKLRLLRADYNSEDWKTHPFGYSIKWH